MLSAEMTNFLEDFMKRLNEEKKGVKSLAETRQLMDKFALEVPFPEDVQVADVNAGGVPAKLISLPVETEGRYILYLHGGGYMMGSFLTHRELAARISREATATVLFPLYRLAPEYPFPAALDDALAAYRWLIHNQGILPERISLVGDSAGGGLAMALLLAIRDRGLPLPAAAAVMSPWTDLACGSQFYQEWLEKDPSQSLASLQAMSKIYAAQADLYDPLLSPLYGDLNGLPPLLIQVGAKELLLSDSTGLAEKAAQAGVAVTLDIGPELFHVFQFVHNAPEAIQAIRQMGAFLKSHSAAQEKVLH